MLLLLFFVILVEQNTLVQILNNVKFSNLATEIAVRNVIQVPENSLKTGHKILSI